MARKKQPEATRAAIIRAAFFAFSERGYEATTVSDLLKASGLSKGAFYHHFKSKEELLDALIEQISTRALEQVTAAVDEAPDGLAKLECFVSSSRQWRAANVPTLRILMPLIMQPGAVMLRDKLYTRAVDQTTPLLARVLHAGVEDGVFDVVDPDESARQMLLLGQLVGRDQGRDLLQGSIQPIITRANVYLTNVERMVGIPEDTLSRPSRRMVAKIVRALQEE